MAKDVKIMDFEYEARRDKRIAWFLNDSRIIGKYTDDPGYLSRSQARPAAWEYGMYYEVFFINISESHILNYKFLPA